MALVRKAKMHVCIYHPFYGALLHRLKLIVDWRAPTMYTDAVVIGFNPAFVLSKSWEHLVYIMVHEVTHCALGHPFRRKGRDPKRWNEAIDHVTNLSLNHDPVLKAMFPPEGLADPRFEGMAAEQVYAILDQEAQQQQPQQPQPEPQQGGDDKQELAGAAGSMGDCCDAGASGEQPEQPVEEDGDDDGDTKDGKQAQGDGDDGGEQHNGRTPDEESEDQAQREVNAKPLDQAQLEKLQREWQEAVTTAELAAGGDVEQSIRRAISTAQQCDKSFSEYLDEFAEKCCQTESSWSRPARRFEVYLPSYAQPGIKYLLLAIDTSGSMSAKDLAIAEGAAQKLVEDFNLKGCIVVYCDTQVRGIERFENGDRITLENAQGGGGTRFAPPLRVALELEEQGEELAGVVYFTDLEGEVQCPEDFDQLSILWVCTNRRQRKLDPPGGLGTVCTLWQ